MADNNKRQDEGLDNVIDRCEAKPQSVEVKNVDENEPMTYEEISEVSLLINKLPGPELGKIIKIIVDKQPSLAQDSDDFVIDFEVMQPATLRAVRQYITSLKFYDPNCV